MSAVDELSTEFGKSSYDAEKAEKQRQRAKKSAKKRWQSPFPHVHRASSQRVPLPETNEHEDEFNSQGRRQPLSAAACSARYRAQIELNALDETAEDIAAALVRAMSREKLKQVCLHALRLNGFALTLRDKAKRDRTQEIAKRRERGRSKEIAKRKEKRAQARAEKAALIQANSAS